MVNGRLVVHSLSGHERNHLFINQQGRTFEDQSLTSGIDNPADSRAFATLDYDRDGRLDIALVNANHPLLNLYRNQIGNDANGDTPREFVALRFMGANQQPQASKQTARDGYGAIVEITVDGAKLKREHRCGEGYGAQNSAVMIVGLGGAAQVQQLEVRWPSGDNQPLRRYRRWLSDHGLRKPGTISQRYSLRRTTLRSPYRRTDQSAYRITPQRPPTRPRQSPLAPGIARHDSRFEGLRDHGHLVHCMPGTPAPSQAPRGTVRLATGRVDWTANRSR